MTAEVTYLARRPSIYQEGIKEDAVSGLPQSWWRGQSHIEQAVGKDVPEDGAEHKQGVDTEEDPEQGLLLESLLVVLQHNHAQRQTNHHPTQVSHKARVGAGREGRGVEPQPHCPTKLYTHCEQTDGERERTQYSFSMDMTTAAYMFLRKVWLPFIHTYCKPEPWPSGIT